MMSYLKPALAVSFAALMAACSAPEAEDDTTQAASTAQQTAPVGEDHGAMDHSQMDHGEMDHSAMDHGSMDHGAMAAAEATADGVLNSISSENGTVNITHPPMPEIGWPEMTMDLPVTRAVDLSQFSEGDNVTFTVRRGRDDQFRIVAMQGAADE